MSKVPKTFTPIYHITHFCNLGSIIEKGGLLCDNEMSRQGISHMGIAYKALKDRRARTMVPSPANGTLADYVPFYFANRFPMLGAIKSGKVEDCPEGQKEILHLVSSVESILKRDCKWCFTDGHAIEAPTGFFDNIKYLERIDWNVIGSWEWGNTLQDPDRKRRKQAEFLVNKFFPWPWIEAIGVLNDEMKTRVEEKVGTSTYQPLIKVEPKWYYLKRKKP